MSDDPLEGFCIQPEPTEQDRAAAIICGSNQVLAMGDGMVEFHGFVQEVLASTVGVEIDRLRRERDQYKASWEAAAGAATRRQAFIDQLPRS